MKMNARRPKQKTHTNFDGGKSYDITDPFLKMRLVCASCFFGEPQYYRDSKKINRIGEREDVRRMLSILQPVFTDDWMKLSPKELVEKTIDLCLGKDPEKTLELAVKLRNEDLMRTTPQVILVRAAMHPLTKGTGMIRHFADKICKRGDEPMVCFNYFRKAFPKDKLPMNLKKALKDIIEGFDDYTIAKYKMEKSECRMIDVIKYTHAQSPAIDKLFKGKAKQTKTWNSIVSNSKEEKTQTWEKALKTMPHMALLRNLRNLEQNKVKISLWKEKFLNGVKGGKQFPFRYFSAFKQVANPETKDAIEEALEISYENVPHFNGRTLCLSDNSGSATSTTTSEMGTMNISTIGNLMSIVALKKSDGGDFVIFGDNAEKIECRKKSSTFDILKEAEETRVGGATETGLWTWLVKAIEENIYYDRIFAFSDLQAGYGQLYGRKLDKYVFTRTLNCSYIDVASLINEYRRKVNKNVKVFLIQTAGYHDTIMPEFYKDTYIIGGWSSGILNFANEMEKL